MSDVTTPRPKASQPNWRSEEGTIMAPREIATAVTRDLPSPEALPTVATQIPRLDNQQRSQHGLTALQQNSRLSAIASSHSYNMAVSGVYDHVIDGKGPGQRLQDHGVDWTAWAENIFRAWRTSNGHPAWDMTEAADDAVDSWMNSAPHRRNILARNYSHTGVGVSAHGGSDGRGYF